MNPNQSVDIQLIDRRGKPLGLGSVLLEAHFFTSGKFRYAFKIGRTDERGRLHFSYADVEALRCQNALHNLMDYNTPLDKCDPIMCFVAPSRQALDRQKRNAIDTYLVAPEWPMIWPANLAETSQTMVSLTSPETFVQIEVAPPWE